VFARTAALRGHVLLRLDGAGRCEVPTRDGRTVWLRYSPDLGVHFEGEKSSDA